MISKDLFVCVSQARPILKGGMIEIVLGINTKKAAKHMHISTESLIGISPTVDRNHSYRIA